MLSTQITISRNGQQFGPFTIEQVNSMLASLQLQPSDWAIYGNVTNWVPLHTVPGVAKFPPRPGAPTSDASDKLILPAFILAFMVGPFGIHRFYVGKTGTGIAMLILTLTLFGAIITVIWSLVDWIMIVCGAFTDSNGKKLKQWT